jgi:hypothetical protein
MKYLARAAIVAIALSSCTGRSDRDFAAMQERGQTAMGVDQYISTHRFEALPDGGRIELQRNENDPRDVAAIRSHLKEVMSMFRRGDFSTPGFVHAQEVAGTRVMAARKDFIQYRYADLPQGGEIRISTVDPEVLRAIHAFIAFQQTEHHHE